MRDEIKDAFDLTDNPGSTAPSPEPKPEHSTKRKANGADGTPQGERERHDNRAPIPPSGTATAKSTAARRATVAKASSEELPPAPWLADLMQGKQGPLKNLENVRRALRLAPEFAGAFAWDELAQNVVLTRDTPAGAAGPCEDQTLLRIEAWLQRSGFNVSLPVARGVFLEAYNNAFHPVQQYLDTLIWDKKPRIDLWLHTYAGAEKNTYTKAVGSKWLISAVARAYHPGCKVDTMLILEGLQGGGKSTTFSILGGAWFSDQISAFISKDASMEATRWWIIEQAELNALSKAETSTIKQFISRQRERFRLPYGRVVTDVPRSCVFAGTVNPDCNGYLKDPTGGRRFWPVRTSGALQVDDLRRDRDQLFAEAVHRYRNGDPWWLTDEEEAEARDEQDFRYATDAWEGPLAAWIATDEAAQLKNKTENPITMDRILLEGLKIETGNQGDGHAKKAGLIMSRLGFERVRTGPRDARTYYYRRKAQR